MAFGERLTILRKSRGMSQEQLAEQLDLARQTISKWELDQSTPDLEYIIQLSELFGVTTDYLIKGEEPTERLSPEKQQVLSEKPPKGYTWCFFGGLTFILNSLMGIIALVICSVFVPWKVLYNGYVFEGFLGFLMGSHTLWLFIILILLALLGLFLCAFGFLKNITYGKKRNGAE